jgi:hypothetical protein
MIRPTYAEVKAITSGSAETQSTRNVEFAGRFFPGRHSKECA